MIFAVVKANPSHFVSHLLYAQRFRNQRVGGEESYCLVNLMAVADFLENVDLKALGLGESEKKVMRFVCLSVCLSSSQAYAFFFFSTADLTPIPVHRAALESPAPPVSPEGVPARLRRGVEQQVDAIAGSANKVIWSWTKALVYSVRFYPAPPLIPTPPHQMVQTQIKRLRHGMQRARASGFCAARVGSQLPVSPHHSPAVIARDHLRARQRQRPRSLGR
jgi:hypothetical protein